jgi:hypothetical protein
MKHLSEKLLLLQIKKSVFPKPRQDKEIPQTFVKHKV